MHGSCFVMGSLRNFQHGCNLLRWTRVLLSQPVKRNKRNKMSGRQLDYFRNSLLSSPFKEVLFAMLPDYPIPQSFFPWPWLYSCVPVLSWEGAFFRISDVYTEVSQVFIQS